MKKRILAAASAALLVALLTACLPQTDNDQDIIAHVTESSESVYQTEQMRLETTSDAATIAQPQPETTAAPVSQDDPVRSAFQRTLQTIHDKLYWPEVSYDAKIELSESGTIEDEQFAIVDVDGDGEEELLVSVSNTYVAGMCEIIYGYDPRPMACG